MLTVFGHKVDALKLSQAKQYDVPEKAALKLLACLFSPEELVNGNLTGVTNSKDEVRQKTIKKLNIQRVEYLKGRYSNIIHITSSCARSARFATCARSSLRSLCHCALQLILCGVE